MILPDTLAAPNGLAILVAAVSSFFLGGLWYAKPVFGAAWMRACGFSEEDLEQGGLARIFGLSFALALVAAAVLGLALGPEASLVDGLRIGLLAGCGWVAPMIGIHYLFERRTLVHFGVNAGYAVCALAIMGAVLGAWP